MDEICLPNMTIEHNLSRHITAVPGLNFSEPVIQYYTNSFSRLGITTHFFHTFYSPLALGVRTNKIVYACVE